MCLYFAYHCSFQRMFKVSNLWIIVSYLEHKNIIAYGTLKSLLYRMYMAISPIYFISDNFLSRTNFSSKFKQQIQKSGILPHRKFPLNQKKSPVSITIPTSYETPTLLNFNVNYFLFKFVINTNNLCTWDLVLLIKIIHLLLVSPCNWLLNWINFKNKL